MKSWHIWRALTTEPPIINCAFDQMLNGTSSVPNYKKFLVGYLAYQKHLVIWDRGSILTQYKLSSINQKVATMLVLLQVLESMWSLLWQRWFLNIPCKIGINTHDTKVRLVKFRLRIQSPNFLAFGWIEALLKLSKKPQINCSLFSLPDGTMNHFH